ncbi:peroxidase-related enzyme [Paracoccus sp. (in: a-proteobacteria)]|uniref:peroxidase-related enzyme n=1 Tax=Paracoccus sp. TaxID=267 RepID=UPI0035AF672B
MTHPISRFAVPDLETLPQDMQDAIAKVAEKSGFVPNVFLALAHRPDEFRAFFAYHQALMDKDEGLSKAEREMIVVAVSGLNNCQYCVVAHGAILRIRAKNALIADQVAVNWRKADLTDRQRAMLAYAEKVTLAAHKIGDADHQALRDAGFDINEIWDIGAIAAFFGMSNRMANAGDFRANDEFYMLGRQVPGLQ